VSSLFDTDKLSDRGGREVNEDSSGFEQSGEIYCWVVADGLGGHQSGQVASAVAVAAVLESFRAYSVVSPEAIRRHIGAAEAAIRARQTEKTLRDQMGTTLLILVSDGSFAVWGHVGDSRLYLLRGGKVFFRTRDHAFKAVTAGVRRLEEGQGAEGRSSLLQAVGLETEIIPTVTDAPQPLMSGDAFVLCVDGFWECIFEKELEVDCANSRDSAGWARHAERRLHSIVGPGDDNYTALFVRVTNPLLPAVSISEPPQPEVPGTPPRPRLRNAVIATVVLLLLIGAVIAGRLLVRRKDRIPVRPVPASTGSVASDRAVAAANAWQYPVARIAAGSFTMGTAAGSGRTGRPGSHPGDESPAHQVSLSHDLFFGRYEVSQRDWERVMTSSDPAFAHCADCPVKNVAWLDAVAFANRASRQASLTECYELANRCSPGPTETCVRLKGSCDGYRLPTEAEWEYVAARELPAATLNDPAKLSKEAWYKLNSGGKTHPRPRMDTQAIFDLAGNVAEWVWDVYGPYPAKPATDPTGPDHGQKRVIRGCSYLGDDCSPTRRRGESPEAKLGYLGFRLVCSAAERSTCGGADPGRSR
jgi:serine/threonine protein phosphatase PrpC/formylglycine-generating enzyme required for sulfatase activity